MNIMESNAALWARLRMHLEGAEKAINEWKEHIYKAGIALLEIRIRYVDDAEFSKAFNNAGVTLSRHDRAALISMAREPKKFRKVLDKTDRRSIQLIYEQEFKSPRGFPSARKPPSPEPAKPEAAAKPSKKSEARVDYDKRLSEVKAEIKEKAKSEIDLKVEAKFAAYKAKLDKEYQQKNDELSKLTKRAMLRLNSLHGLVEKDDDTAIIKCLHPDHVASLGPQVVAMHEAGWRAYHKYRDYIIIKPPEGRG